MERMDGSQAAAEILPVHGLGPIQQPAYVSKHFGSSLAGSPRGDIKINPPMELFS